MPDKKKQKSPQNNQQPKQQNKAQKENIQDGNKQQNKGQSVVEQVKQMRKIHERQQMPSDKGQLIQYLSQRINQAQQALGDTQQVLQGQVLQRQKISKAIDQRNKQLQKLYQVDQKGLPQKIKQRLTQILTQTINQKIEAEEQLKDERSQNYEYKSRYEQLKWEQQQSKQKLQELSITEAGLNAQITQYQQLVQQHERQLKQQQQEFEAVKQKKEALEDKYLQMKVALERMTDIKAVLNRFFGNEDLFDQKMDLKQQNVSRPQIHTPSEQQRSEARVPSRQNRNVTKLKPLNNSRKKEINDDEDFWKGDYSAKTRNF